MIYQRLANFISLGVIMGTILTPFNFANAAVNVSLPLNNTGLIGYWTFDGKNVTNGRINDISGQGAHGNPVNIATSTFYASGKIGQAANLDGVDDRIDLSSSSFAQIGSGDITVSAWVYYTGDDGGIVSTKDTGPLGSTKGYALAHDSGNGGLTWHVDNDNGQVSLLGETISVGWHHVAGVFVNGTSNKLYIDGVLTDTDVSDIPSGNLSSLNTMKMGTYGSGNVPFAGKVDQVRVYNRALSDAEVRGLYNHGAGKIAASNKTILSPGLLAHWTFDGKNIVNGVVNDAIGAINGNTLNIATTTFYAPGIVGQALKFDGVNDGVNFGDVNSLEGLSAFSFGGWFKFNGSNSSGIHSFGGKYNGNFANGPFTLWYSGISEVLIFTVCTSAATCTNASIALTPTQFSDGKWRHLVGTFDGTTIRIYLDGTKGTDGSLSGSSMTDSTTFKLGQTDTANDFCNCMLDDFRFFTKTLSQNEIKGLMAIAQGKQNVSPVSAVNNGLVGHWTFDGKDMVNGVARDKSGQGNNGNPKDIASSTFYTAGKIGQGIQLDGANDQVEVPAASSINNLGPMSISMWVHPIDYSACLAYNCALVDKQTAVHGWAYLIANEGSTVFRTYQTGGNDLMVNPTSQIPLNRWTHVVLAWDGSQTYTNASIYHNGVLQSLSAVGSQNGTGTRIDDSDKPIHIGWNRYDGYYFKTKIDDVRIYNRKLTAAEAAALYNMGR